MSLIVAYQGQFKPYTVEPSKSLNQRVKEVDRSEPVFDDILKEMAGENYEEGEEGKDNKDNKTSPGQPESAPIDSYKKTQKAPRSRALAKDIMSDFVKTLPSSASIRQAMDLMEKRQLRHIPVVDSGKMTGIISDRNLLSALALGKKINVQLGDIMTAQVISGQEHTAISDIARVMVEKKIHGLPIIDAQTRLKGIITSTDILRFLTTSFPFEMYG